MANYNFGQDTQQQSPMTPNFNWGNTQPAGSQSTLQSPAQTPGILNNFLNAGNVGGDNLYDRGGSILGSMFDFNLSGLDGPTGTDDPGFMQGMLGHKNPDGSAVSGWGMPALQAITGGANTFLGIKQYDLAKKSLKENTRQFDLNFGNQAKLTNTQLRDRQDARNASGGNYMPTDEYMRLNEV